MNTKEKIVSKSLFLFNKFGFINVRLQHIADESEMSVGNLAYHFKNKDAIMEHLLSQIQKKQNELLAELRIVPIFENINEHLKSTYTIQREYSFFYTDTLEILRSYPLLKPIYRNHAFWFREQIRLMITFNVARGAFKTLSHDMDAKMLSDSYWKQLELSFYKARLLGLMDYSEADFVKEAWFVLIPHFTDVGEKEYFQLLRKGNLNW
ncbi:TetR/AcrR family transcriptional regulator [Jiulongibacter sediminis]|uniref:TetR/AcrR family transcriptional regulator n=1 Tax=Jiulongibacter sediminis TaxID=1605367 RepID=UPI0006DCCC68|nr:TetR/AcrR family transcriptional regulator [Jiulongibacter sediminis]